MASDMITRRYEHPDGGRCMIRFPQGWSRKCYYETDVYRKDGSLFSARYDTPQQAREEAIAYEGVLFTNGWRPAGMPDRGPADETIAALEQQQRTALIARLSDDSAANAQGANYIGWLNQQCASLPAADRAGVVAEVLRRRHERANDARAATGVTAEDKRQKILAAFPALRVPRQETAVTPAAEFDQPKRRKIVLGD